MLDAVQRAARDQFEKQSDRYGKSHILANPEDVAAGLDGVAIPPNGRALDVATGGGHTAVFLAGQGWEVTATDLSAAMLENAAKLAEERKVPLTTSLHAAEEFPHPDSSFDLITCRVAAHHFSNPAAFLAETRRVLKAGGHFLLIDGTVPDDEPVAADWIHQVEKLRDPSHGRFLSPSEWTALCGEHGLHVLRCTTAPFKQPDLEWYFQTADTPLENREKVRELVRNAPEASRRVFRLAEEEGKTIWWWRRLTLLAEKS